LDWGLANCKFFTYAERHTKEPNIHIHVSSGIRINDRSFEAVGGSTSLIDLNILRNIIFCEIRVMLELIKIELR
jgi:hypothetical protein